MPARVSKMRVHFYRSASLSLEVTLPGVAVQVARDMPRSRATWVAGGIVDS